MALHTSLYAPGHSLQPVVSKEWHVVGRDSVKLSYYLRQFYDDT